MLTSKSFDITVSPLAFARVLPSITNAAYLRLSSATGSITHDLNKWVSDRA